MKIVPATLASLLVALSLGAAAQSTPGVDQRQDQQSARIQQGAQSGSLTPREQRRLQREQRAVQRAENRAKADGVVTPKERRRLDRMQDKASADIARQKHDRQRVHRPGMAASAGR